MNKQLKQLFEKVMKELGFATGFELNEYSLDFYTYGGGYMIVQRCANTSGERTPFGSLRRSKHEMESFLRGMLALHDHQQRLRDIAAMSEKVMTPFGWTHIDGGVQ